MLELYRSCGPSATRDLAAEAWLMERAATGVASLFVYSWPGPVVVLGYGQSPADVDLEWCREERIPVLRRASGGTGVVHQGDVAVSLALPREHPWAAGVIGLYDRFLSCLAPALNAAGGRVERIVRGERARRERSPVCFEEQSSDTLLSGGRKVVGCAQSRRRGAVLVHAAVLLGLDAELYARVFRVSPARIAAGLGAAVPGGRWQAVGDAVAAQLAAALGRELVHGELPSLELRHLQPYGSARWAPVPELHGADDRNAK